MHPHPGKAMETDGVSRIVREKVCHRSHASKKSPDPKGEGKERRGSVFVGYVFLH